MTISGLIDLHMHTTVSDGTDTPEALVPRVKEAGIGLFAVTDHDSFKACEAIRPILKETDPAFLTGVEFSCQDEEGKYHILGYGFDPGAASICEVIRLGHQYRFNKLKARLDLLKKTFGFRFSDEEVNALFALDNPGKPHIGNLMVKHGYVRSRDEAIKQFIDRLHSRNEYVRPEEAIKGILGAGGIPVLAHPSYGDGDQLILGEEMDERLKKLIGFGLQGVEAFYSGFTVKIREEVLAFAEKYDLYITAGSDYHGSNKLVVLGDTGMTEDTIWPEGLKRFLEDVKRE